MLADVRKADYNLSPSQFVEVGDRATHRDLAAILADLRAAREWMQREPRRKGTIYRAQRRPSDGPTTALPGAYRW